MKAVLILLLTGVLLIQPSGSLWCYTCHIQLRSDSCRRAVFCQDMTKACKTDVISLMGLLNIISRKCASSCSMYSMNMPFVKRNISCCSEDLCNGDEISTSPTNRAQMAMVAFSSLATLILSRLL